VARSSTVCGKWTGARANCGARHGAWKRRIENSRLNSAAPPAKTKVAAELGIPLQEFQHLLGELDSLEVGSLRIESPWDGKEEDLCDYLPNAPEDTPFFRACARR